MFQKGPFIVFRLIGALVLVGLLVGGGFMAYNAGVARGIAQAPEVAQAIEQASEDGQPAPLPPMMYGNGYGHGDGRGFYPYQHFGFFPFGTICGSILFLFFFLGLMKMIFFHGMWHRGHHGHWGRHWEDGVPPIFNDWHKRAHGEKPAEEAAKEE